MATWLSEIRQLGDAVRTLRFDNAQKSLLSAIRALPGSVTRPQLLINHPAAKQYMTTEDASPAS